MKVALAFQGPEHWSFMLGVWRYGRWLYVDLIWFSIRFDLGEAA